MSASEPQHKIDFEINESVRITDGPFKNFEGKVSNVDQERGKVKVLITMFGRETPVELDAMQVKKA
jgi:transcriptional antiterminator NusG